MSTNSRFAVGVHILTLLALQQKSLPSAAIAGSVNTNPVVIRRILGALHKAGLVNTQQGAEGGASLARSPAQITLRDVYCAVQAGGLFAMHHSQPNPLCPCGRHIQPLLATAFEKAEDAMKMALAETTIAQAAQAIETFQNSSREL